MRFVIFAAVVASSYCLAGEPPIELKGIFLGSTTTQEARSKWPALEIYGDRLVISPSSNANFLCGSSVASFGSKCRDDAIDSLRLAGGAAGDYWFTSLEGKIESAACDFHISSFQLVEGAMVSKFGPPTTTTTKPWRNRRGNEFTSKTLTWERSDGKITLSEYGKTTDTSRLEMTTTKLIKHEADTLKAKQRAGAGQL